jgi:hypothetical protein
MSECSGAEDRKRFRNACLCALLELEEPIRGPVIWSQHAKDRLRELAAQGLRPGCAEDALAGVRCRTWWSERHCAVSRRSGDLTLGLEMDPRGAIVVTTVLPASPELWERVYASGLVAEGRAVREREEIMR